MPKSEERRYWKAKGETKKALQELNKKRSDAMQKAHRFSRRVGAHRKRLAVWEGVFSWGFALLFSKEPDKTLWKNPGRGNRKDEKCWVPRRSSKEGKKFAEEMDAISREVGGLNGYSKLIGLDNFSSPGFCMVGNEVYLVTNARFKGHKDLREVSNLTYKKTTERLKSKKVG